MFIADIRRCDLNDLFYFAMVVEHGGFSQAGRALAMPKSKLSRRVALLEERLGVRLIQRSTRRFSVTEVGQDYYRHCKAMLVEAEAAEEAIAMSRAEPRGTIRLACPIAILHARIGTMLADFLALHPQVTVQLDATNRRVDVVGEGMDVAIACGRRRWRTVTWWYACWRAGSGAPVPARRCCSGWARRRCRPTWR